LGEKGVLDLVNEMDMLGVVEALNLSRGRYRYAKVVSLKVDAEKVLNFLDPEWRKRQERNKKLIEIEAKVNYPPLKSVGL
jgi:ribonuclease HI